MLIKPAYTGLRTVKVLVICWSRKGGRYIINTLTTFNEIYGIGNCIHTRVSKGKFVLNITKNNKKM